MMCVLYVVRVRYEYCNFFLNAFVYAMQQLMIELTMFFSKFEYAGLYMLPLTFLCILLENLYMGGKYLITCKDFCCLVP
jgi:hypothetical protein